MGEFLSIRCLVSTSVSIDDLDVRLVGKGAEKTVLTASANVSLDLRKRIAERQVSIHPAGKSNARIWPFVPTAILPDLPPSPPSAPVPVPQPAAPAKNPHHDPETVRLLSSIDEKLGALLMRPSPPPAEVVAAHVRAISSMTAVPDGLPGAPHPQFIPSSILPSDPNAGTDIKVKQTDVSVGVDDSVNALRELRKKR